MAFVRQRRQFLAFQRRTQLRKLQRPRASPLITAEGPTAVAFFWPVQGRLQGGFAAALVSARIGDPRSAIRLSLARVPAARHSDLFRMRDSDRTPITFGGSRFNSFGGYPRIWQPRIWQRTGLARKRLSRVPRIRLRLGERLLAPLRLGWRLFRDELFWLWLGRLGLWRGMAVLGLRMGPLVVQPLLVCAVVQLLPCTTPGTTITPQYDPYDADDYDSRASYSIAPSLDAAALHFDINVGVGD